MRPGCPDPPGSPARPRECRDRRLRRSRPCSRLGAWPIGRRCAAGRPGAATPVPAFADHRELLRQQAPDALAIFTPHLSHYRLTMDALQAGCHVFIEKPLSTNSQEAADIVSLARGRGLKVGVGHQFRLCPSLIEARRRVAAGEIGPVRLVTAVLARPWLSTLAREESSWRFDPKVAGRRHPGRCRRPLDRRPALDHRAKGAGGRCHSKSARARDRSRDGRRDSTGGRNTSLAGRFGHFARGPALR